MLAGISGVVEKFCIVVSNPPYVKWAEFQQLPEEIRGHEPHYALDGGPDGLDVIGRIIAHAPEVLRQGGCLFLEIGAGQAKSVSELVSKSKKYKSSRFIKDYSGINRVLAAEKR